MSVDGNKIVGDISLIKDQRDDLDPVTVSFVSGDEKITYARYEAGRYLKGSDENIICSMVGGRTVYIDQTTNEIWISLFDHDGKVKIFTEADEEKKNTLSWIGKGEK